MVEQTNVVTGRGFPPIPNRNKVLRSEADTSCFDSVLRNVQPNPPEFDPLAGKYLTIGAGLNQQLRVRGSDLDSIASAGIQESWRLAMLVALDSAVAEPSQASITAYLNDLVGKEHELGLKQNDARALFASAFSGLNAVPATKVGDHWRFENAAVGRELGRNGAIQL